MRTFENQDQDVVARVQTSLPGRRRCLSSAEVWDICEKTPLPHSTRCRTGADVVARVHAFSPGRRRCRRCVDVVARALKFGVFMKNTPPTQHPSSPGCMYCCPRTCVLARAYTSLPEQGRFRPGVDGCGRPTTPACDRRRCRQRRPCVRSNLRGYKRRNPPFSPHFVSIQSFLAWTCPLAAPCENLTERTLAFFSYCVLCLCESHKRIVDHLHILDYERP